MCTLPRNTTLAIVPPISAAAMLSRKLDSTKIMTSRTNPPFQSSGRKRGRMAGTRLASKCLDSSAKPSSRPSRLASSTHSCARCATKPSMPAPSGKGENRILNSVMTTSPTTATRSVWWWNSATPSSVAANRMKSIGMPAMAGGSGSPVAGRQDRRGGQGRRPVRRQAGSIGALRQAREGGIGVSEGGVGRRDGSAANPAFGPFSMDSAPRCRRALYGDADCNRGDPPAAKGKPV